MKNQNQVRKDGNKKGGRGQSAKPRKNASVKGAAGQTAEWVGTLVSQAEREAIHAAVWRRGMQPRQFDEAVRWFLVEAIRRELAQPAEEPLRQRLSALLDGEGVRVAGQYAGLVTMAGYKLDEMAASETTTHDRMIKEGLAWTLIEYGDRVKAFVHGLEAVLGGPKPGKGGAS